MLAAGPAITPLLIAGLVPLLTGSLIGLIGYLLRHVIIGGFAQVEARLDRQSQKLDALDDSVSSSYGRVEVRLTRLESWRDLHEIGHPWPRPGGQRAYDPKGPVGGQADD